MANMGMPHGGPQDRADVVATNVLTSVFLHLRDHWVTNINPGLRSQIATLLREEFADVAATARSETSPRNEDDD
jgi:hypothetical protein